MMSNGEDLKAALDMALKKVAVKRKAMKIATDEFNDAYREFEQAGNKLSAARGVDDE